MDQPQTVPPPGAPSAPAEQPQWRHDFPIDLPQDQYVARRDFTKFMVLISGAFAVGQWCIALQNLWRRGTGRPPVRRVAGVNEIPVGGARLFHYPTEADGCLLLRTAADQFLAYSNQCTHLMCALVPRLDAGRLHCPCHNGDFDVATGRPTNGPPRRPLPRITLERRGDDLYAVGVELEAR